MKKENQELRFQKWQQILLEQTNSGLSQKAFCEKNNVVLPQFLYYRCLIKKKAKLDEKNQPSSSILMRNAESHSWMC